MITSTIDRARSHARGAASSPDAYATRLAERGLPAVYCGYAAPGGTAGDRIITIHDPLIWSARSTAPGERPLAILAAYNETDVIAEAVQDLVEQGCDVWAIDNWSSDGTFEQLERLAASDPAHIALERFPADGPVPHYEWRQILRRKEEIAQRFPGRWIVHTDADELRRSPFAGTTLADGFRIAEGAGANRVNFSLINFRPVDSAPFLAGSLKTAFAWFEYGTRPGHFKQAKAWLQGDERIDLASSGGHSATFPGAADLPYRFLLQHFPTRSVEHGRRKVLRERQQRWSPEERALGWHTHYDSFHAASSFIWQREELNAYGPDFWQRHGLALLTDIAELRLTSAALPAG